MSRILPVLMVLASTSLALGQSAFTYQGKLDDTGVPASGMHDLRFRLFDAAVGGAQVGSTVCIDNVSVADGLFTVQLDFGQQFAALAPRHLDIQVRRDIGQPCTDDFGYVLLSPRQPLTATPRAQAANVANALAAPDGSPASAVFVNNSGNVGIGTQAPSVPLHITRDIDPVLILQDTGLNSTQAGYVGFWNGSGVETGWMGFGSPTNPHLTVFNDRAGGDVVLQPASGKVRIGAAGEFFATGDGENLRIVRGVVRQNAPDDGSGFSVSHPMTGVFNITFLTPFTDVPAFTATAELVGISGIAQINSISASSVELIIVARDSGHAVDRDFHFIAVGPR